MEPLAFLPSLFLFVGIAALVKLSARVFRRTVLSWKRCFFYVGLLILLMLVTAGIVGLVTAGNPASIPPYIGLPLGVLLHFGFATWFFSKFAKTQDGESLNVIAAAKLSGLVLGSLFALILGLSAVLWLASAIVGSPK